MLRRALSRRALGTIALAAAAAAGSVAGVGFAQGNGGAAPKKPAGTQSAPSPSDPILAGVHRILEGLVAAGSIDQQQSDAVGAQADAGSIDPQQLVGSGVVTEAQMRLIATRVDRLKRSYSR